MLNPNSALRIYFGRLTLNDLPKNHLIWRASVRLPEMLRKIMTVYRAVQDCALVRLHAEDQVFVFSRGETPQGAAVPDIRWCWLSFKQTTVCIIPHPSAGICNGLLRYRLRSQQGRAEELSRPGEQADREPCRFQGLGRARRAGRAGADALRRRRFQAEPGDR